MNTSVLAQELGLLSAQIEQARQKQEALEGELRIVEAELETFSGERQRFDALRDICNALDKLRTLEADELFWEGVAAARNAVGQVERARIRVAYFEGQISGVLEKQASLREQINQCVEEQDILYEEVRDAYDREERRKEEFVVEREVSSVPYRAMIMPWTNEAESGRRFRRAVLLAMLICFVFGSLIPMVKVPIPDRSVVVAEIPRRLVELVKKESLTRMPSRKTVPKQLAEKAKAESKPARTEPEVAPNEPEPARTASEKVKEETKAPPHEQKSDAPPPVADQPKAVPPGGGGGESALARKKAEALGVLVFKDAFKDLMKETRVAKLGTEARLSKENQRVAGRAVAQRSMVSIQAQSGSSGGIGYASVSRNIGSGNVDRLGGIGIGNSSGSGSGSGGGSGGGSGNGTGVGIGRVSSNIANLEESSRPLSDGVALGRTDEEIQIVFDRYKATLYRIYNQELRKDPALRGKILMRISIETSGVVSMCKVEATDLASPELVDKIVERVKRFNFGPKEGVPKITILYPIDFLPAG